MIKNSTKTGNYDIRKLRTRLRLSQSDCASMLGWSTRKLQRVECSATYEQFVLFVKSYGEFVVPENRYDIFRINDELFDVKKFEK